jgi:hypothetical protein
MVMDFDCHLHDVAVYFRLSSYSYQRDNGGKLELLVRFSLPFFDGNFSSRFRLFLQGQLICNAFQH